MKLLSWNADYRVNSNPRQLDFIAETAPDILALQEVSPNADRFFQTELPGIGLSHIASSYDYDIDQSKRPRRRRCGVLLASRWPLRVPRPFALNLPWPEQGLSATVRSPHGPVRTHTVHVPAGSMYGIVKVLTFNRIFGSLAGSAPGGHRVLCGDFNSPEEEYPDPDRPPLMFGGSRSLAGRRQRAAEERVMLGLAEYDLADAFRARHGYGGIQYEIPDDPRSTNQFSWTTPQNPNIRRRFDHIFSSRSLPPAECDYLHKPREDGLSDHSPVYALFQPA